MPSLLTTSTLFLQALTTLLPPTFAVATTYVLTDNYSGDTFFGAFTAFTDPDPTSGFVNFLSYENGIKQDLIAATANYDNSSYLGVDHTTPSPASGRASHRLTSKKSFNEGLFVADIAHMPVGCGTWPAFWLLGPEWPKNGEIDIIEGVNNAGSNQMTLHTSAGCSISNQYATPNSIINTTDCDTNAPSQKKNAGCAVVAKASNTFGAGFNAVGGGVYATEWTSSAIKIWFWPRAGIPADINAGKPDPNKWGQPLAHFCGECDMKAYFQNLQIVFDTTFCGQWAGDPGVWGSGECGAKAPTCEAFVKGTPKAFGDAYWLVNGVRVYQQGGGGVRKRGVQVGVEEW